MGVDGQAELALDLDFNSVAGDPDSAEAFKQHFIADMAATLGCDPSAIVVDGLEAGSVIVQFKIRDIGGETNPADLLQVCAHTSQRPNCENCHVPDNLGHQLTRTFPCPEFE